ncbi:aspartate aminotransferase family protein [Spirochaetota bacterium]
MASLKMITRNSKNYLLNTYKRKDICFTKGKSATLTDIKGKKYIDFLSGIAVNNLGYSHPELIKSIRKAMKGVWHTSNLYHIDSQAELAKLIVKSAFKGKCFFCNSGTEANEAAYKLVKKYGKIVSPRKSDIVSMFDSFHGRSMGALSITGQKKYQEDFKPVLPAKFSKFNDPNDLARKVDFNTAAVIIEAVQGESGIHVATKEFLRAVRDLCNRYNALMIVDEVQTGCCRTGKIFAYQHYDVTPDVITMAKALGGGLPIGCMLVRDKHADIFAPGDHASTFGGNRFITTAALSAFKIYSSASFQKKVKQKEKYILKKLHEFTNNFPFIKEIRSRGLMIGIQIDTESPVSAAKIEELSLAGGLLVNNIKDKIIRLVPPLVIRNEEIDRGMRILYKAFSRAEEML